MSRRLCLNVVMVGEESAGLQTLNSLLSAGHRVAAVMAQPDRGGASVWHAARRMGLDTWDAARVRDPAVAAELRQQSVDLLINVHSLFRIHHEVLAAPRLGSYNLHPGPLPRYAGLNTVSWALAQGETDYGVTVHRMEPAIDAGAIAFQRCFPIAPDETALSLYRRCIRDGVALIEELLDTAGRGEEIPSRPQDLAARSYFRGAPPDDCRVRWSRAAREIANLVRACDYFPFPSPWGHPRAALGDRPLHIIKARLTGRAANVRPGTIGVAAATAVDVACGDEWLQLDKVMADGRIVAAVEALHGAGRLDDGL